MLAGRAKGSPLLHEAWGDNIFLETNVEIDIAKALNAPIKVTREIVTSRERLYRLRRAVQRTRRRIPRCPGMRELLPQGRDPRDE